MDEPITDAEIARVARKHGTGPAARWSGRSAVTVVKIRRASGERYKRGRGHPSKEEMRKALPNVYCRCRMCLEWKVERKAEIERRKVEMAELKRLGDAWKRLEAAEQARLAELAKAEKEERLRLEEIETRERREREVQEAADAWMAMMRRVQAKSYAPPEPEAVWQNLAVCTEADHRLFYPLHPTRNRGEADPVELWIGGRLRAMKRYNPDLYEPAKSICVLCPVREDCLQYALEHDERWGVWGGLDWFERDLLAGYLPTGYREPSRGTKDVDVAEIEVELAS